MKTYIAILVHEHHLPNNLDITYRLSSPVNSRSAMSVNHSSLPFPTGCYDVHALIISSLHCCNDLLIHGLFLL